MVNFKQKVSTAHAIYSCQTRGLRMLSAKLLPDCSAAEQVYEGKFKKFLFKTNLTINTS
jgi:hypothetical protein